MQTFHSKNNESVQKKTDNTVSTVLDKSSQSESLQRKADLANGAAQRTEAPRPNNTGMPDNLKAGIESLSGFSMDDVRVHYNSSKPATVQALAYTQGTDIHVAPGQEKHLPHEAWHVAQQMAGRVSPTTNINGMPVNDNADLEHEADVMGERAVQCKKKDFSLFNDLNAPKMVQFFKRGNNDFKSQGRADSDIQSGIWFLNTPLGQAGKKRDHIIPLELIQDFANIAFSTVLKDKKRSNLWLINAVKNFGKLSRSGNQNGANKHFTTNAGMALSPEQEKLLIYQITENPKKTLQGQPDFGWFPILVKAISWMPGNVFISPIGRCDDPGNKFDYASKFFVSSDNYSTLFNTYCYMRDVVNKKCREDQKDNYIYSALDGLGKIANWEGPYPFDGDHWFSKSTGKSFNTMLANNEDTRNNEWNAK